jgi:hypothetical protein
MNNTIGAAILIGVAVVVVVLAACQPWILDDGNRFLAGFVSYDLLSILGVIVAITTASASNIHLELRRLEAEYKAKDAFAATRGQVKSGAMALIYLLLFAFALVMIKPVVASSTHIQALINGAAVWIFVWNILVLVAQLRLAFKVGPLDLD